MLLTAERGCGKVLGEQALCRLPADITQEAAPEVCFGLTIVALATTVHIYPPISTRLHQAAQLNAVAQGMVYLFHLFPSHIFLLDAPVQNG